MTARPRHPKKDVEKALQFAEAQGWIVTTKSGHAWGQMRCPAGDHQAFVWGTPKNPTVHAKQLQKAVIRCPDNTTKK